MSQVWPRSPNKHWAPVSCLYRRVLFGAPGSAVGLNAVEELIDRGFVYELDGLLTTVWQVQYPELTLVMGLKEDLNPPRNLWELLDQADLLSAGDYDWLITTLEEQLERLKRRREAGRLPETTAPANLADRIAAYLEDSGPSTPDDLEIVLGERSTVIGWACSRDPRFERLGERKWRLKELI